MSKQGVVNIRGKEYLTVAHRVNLFRERFKPEDGWAIRTWLVHHDDDRVVIQATICTGEDHVVAQGFAEEYRAASKINQTSAMENCETSAIGRALAAFGFGGEEYCSADELVNALSQQSSPKTVKKQQEPEKEDNKQDPKELIVAKLVELKELVGADEAKERWTNLLKHSDNSDGHLTLEGIKGHTKLYGIYHELKEMIETIVKTKESDNE